MSRRSAAQVNLRPYQREAIDAVLRARREGARRLLVCLPTGAGKTVVFAELARLARRQVLVLAHREELLAQARDKIAAAMAGEAVVSIERGAETAAPEAKVLVASIRSLHEERLARVLRGRDIGLVVYDECHHAAADDNLRVLRQLGAFDEGWSGTLLGFTATTARGDGKGLDDVFERIVYARSLPEMIADGHRVYAHRVHDENRKAMPYWRDVGTLDAYYQANIDLIGVEPVLNLYDDRWPIRTWQPQSLPPKFVFSEDGPLGVARRGQALDSLVSPGCIVSGGQVRRSILSPQVRVNSYATVEDSILFEGVNVGRYCRIRRAIIDKDVKLPPYTVLGYDSEFDRARGFTITEQGIVVVPKSEPPETFQSPNKLPI